MDKDTKNTSSSVRYDAKSDPGPLPRWLKVGAPIAVAIAVVVIWLVRSRG